MVAASALLLGTSALAVAAGADTTDKPMVAPVAAVATPISEKPIEPELTLGEKAQMQLAMLDKSDNPVQPELTLGEKTQMQLAMLDKSDDKTLLDASDGKVETASVDKVDESATGMGGPIEQADAGPIADLTPRPATQNYPACDPGPGDDHCIQLYERGVRAQLPAGTGRPAALPTARRRPRWAGRTSRSTIQRSRPLPADTVAPTTAAVGETSEPELAAHSDMQGVGGPVEAQSGYPPCSPGPGDDRCIQLYERGVTGAGN
jgi:hypothetical protein